MSDPMKIEIVDEDEVMNEVTSPTVVETAPPPMATTMSADEQLIFKALEMGDVGALERIQALIERRDEREAKRQYDLHFAEMQAEFVPAHRTKEGKNFTYAPVEELQKTYNPIIAKHGFSYRWSEEKLESGDKRCTLTISGWGYSRENSFDVPKLDPVRSREGKDVQNAVQVAGAMSTYGRRYTFIAGFGVIIDDEDTDGTLDVKEEFVEELASLNGCRSEQEVQHLWRTSIYPRVKDNPRSFKVLAAEKDARIQRIKNVG